MKLTTTIECTTCVAARLADDGTCDVKVFGHAEYARGRTTTAEIAVPPEVAAKVAAALTDARAAVMAALGPAMQKAIAKSADVAAARGELQ